MRIDIEPGYHTCRLAICQSCLRLVLPCSGEMGSAPKVGLHSTIFVDPR